jgi:putative hemolysin
MEILIVLFLIILNGIFAMAELAIVSSRKSKLRKESNDGNKNAQAALELAESPNRFLSTVQVGITLIGIFAGAFGGATIADSLAKQLNQIPAIAMYSDAIALAIVVTCITYLSLIVGELVPKRLALAHPEGIAKSLAKPMRWVSIIGGPLVSFLSLSTDAIIKLLRIKPNEEPSVSEEEVRMLLREGTQVGVFDVAEKDIVERTLKLGDKRIPTLMTSRKEITWFDIDSKFKTIRNKIMKSPHAYYPVCRDNLDKVIGVVRAEDMLRSFLSEEKIALKTFLLKPLFIPESMDALQVLELFKKSGVHMAIVIDEFGNVQGILALNDILEAIVGDIPTINELEEDEIIKRDDNSWFVDGLVSIDEFKEYFKIKKLPDERSGVFHTLGGFVMHNLGKVPVSGDKFEWDNYHFEIVDMDGNRVDKIIVKKNTASHQE